jgi:hypothetical protein
MTIATAAKQIVIDRMDVVAAGGQESISLVQTAEMRVAPDRELMAMHGAIYMPMLQTAETVAQRYGISREAQDEYALQSQQRTAAAQAAGKFADEIVPVTVTMKVQDKTTGEISDKEVTIAKDEGNRADTTLEGLNGLKPVMGEGTTITAGNASQLSDGSSASILMEASLAEKRGLTPLGRYIGMAVAGTEPDEMGIGPVFAIPKLLTRFGLKVEDIGIWELNEAFAVQVIYCRDKLGHPQRPAERQRRLDLDRPPLWHDRGALHRPCAAGRQTHGRQIRRSDDVRGRRHGRGGAVRDLLSGASDMDERWPELDYAADRPVIEALHAYLQLIGKLPTRGLPWLNHGWHTALRVVPRGFRTYPVPLAAGEGELLLDCLDGCIRLETSFGLVRSVNLRRRHVAEVYAELTAALGEVGCPIEIAGAPNEVDPAVPFHDDRRDRHWDDDVVHRIHRAFALVNRVFEEFRSGFVGKASPSHLFWGSFDLAVTRFSGREAPLHPGGVPISPTGSRARPTATKWRARASGWAAMASRRRHSTPTAILLRLISQSAPSPLARRSGPPRSASSSCPMRPCATHRIRPRLWDRSCKALMRR